MAPALPRWAPSPAELDDLDMILLGAYAGLDGLPDESARRHVARTGCLADGTPLPVCPTLVVPRAVADEARSAGGLVLVDEEGAPEAELTVSELTEVAEVTGPADAVAEARDRVALAGPVRSVRDQPRGSHPSLRPPAPGAGTATGTVLVVPVDRPPHRGLLVQVQAVADALGATVMLMPLTGRGRPRGMDGSALVRVCLAIHAAIPATVVPVSVPRHHDVADAWSDGALVGYVAAAYGASHLISEAADLAGAAGPLIEVDLPAVAMDLRTGQWHRLEDVPAPYRSHRGLDDVEHHVEAVIGRHVEVEPGLFDAAVERELRRLRPGGRLGFAVLFTGLSGAGKSTIARQLRDRIHDGTERTVTLLDGDVVRRMLSSELTFSREHRALNVRRIGFVAAQVASHGGIALCAPIAPYDETRREVRSMVESTGAGFVLVHVATPLEVCEQRDRKGLYARARAGLVPEFTGVSDPYDVPADADVIVDTAVLGPEAAVAAILDHVVERRWLERD